MELGRKNTLLRRAWMDTLPVMAGYLVLGLGFLPFLIFGGGKKTPPFIAYLGRVLPCAIIGMLVVFCLRNIDLHSAAGFLPELIACALTAALHLWRRNTLLSIGAGTVCYMLLVQWVF